MKFFTTILIFLIITTALHAQIVTQSWAALASGANPRAIAIDASGNVYTANYNDNTVSKITSGGTVTQAWAALASNAFPIAIAIDGSGNVYTANFNDNTVSKITSGGTLTQVWAILSSSANPNGIAIDGSSNVYTVNRNNNTVSKITPNGTITQAWAALASNAFPIGIAIDGSGNVYTANKSNNTVSKITSGGTVTQAWATLNSGAGPFGIAIDGSGNIYTSNINNNTVSKITPGGTVTQAWATLNSNAYPNAIAIDGSGNVYTANRNNNTVSKITSGGTLKQTWAALAFGVKPFGIAIDGSGNVYTANNVNSTVSRILVNNTWSGVTSNLWSTTSNWSFSALPVATDNVIIPSVTNLPIISSSTVAAVNNLTVNSGASLTVEPGGALTVTGTATGTVTLQQSIIGQRGYRMFANPFSTATDIAITATNNTIAIATTPYSGSNLTDARVFSNSTNLWGNVTGTTLAANTPYALFIRGLNSEVSGATYTGGPSAFTYNVSGTLNAASTSITPGSTANFMLVGNPYAAPVNTQALTGGNSLPYYTYQIAVTGTPQVKAGSWVAAGSNSDATSTIPVLGVVAYLPSSTTLYNVTTSDINTSGTLQTGLFGANDGKQLELLVEQDGYFQDKLFVRLDATATANATDNVDLIKFYNDNVNVYTINKDQNLRLAVDARKDLDNSIPMGISGLAGTYNLKVASNSLLEGSTVMLEDKFLNTQTELKTGTAYNFSISSDAASKGENRFVLNFTQKATAVIADATATGFTAKVLGNITHGSVTVKIAGSTTQVTITVVDINGKAIKTVHAANGTNTINLGNTAAGIKLLQVSNGTTTILEKVINQ